MATTDDETPLGRCIKSAPTLLTLPLEVRLQIYEELLISISTTRARRGKLQIINLAPDSVKKPEEPHSMFTAILRTCKQAHDEGTSVLYSKNLLYCPNVAVGHEFITQIGEANLALIKNLQFYAPWRDELASWLQMLEILSTRAPGLRIFSIWFCGKIGDGWPFKHGEKERGYGENAEIARAITQLKQIDRFLLRGYFGVNWPAYFEREMGKERVEEIGLHWPEAWADSSLPKEEWEEQLAWLRNENALFLQEKKEFQEGTEDIWP